MGHLKDLKITVLNDLVDTLKLHFYSSHLSDEKELEDYNKIVDSFCSIKSEAQQIKNQDNQKRFISHEFHGYKFHVMATAQSGFNVVIQNGDVSISLLKHSIKHSNPLIKVEFRAEYLCRMGYIKAIQSVKNLIQNFLLNYHVKVSEIHLAKDIQGYEFCTFDFHRVKTLSKTKTIFHNDISSEYYFGNRFTGFSIGKGDEMLRIYNKTLEINQKKQKSFIEVLKWAHNPDFDNKQNVWRLEFQLRRERLKHLLGNDGLLDSLENVLNSISNLWNYCINRFVHKNLNNSEVHEQITQMKKLKNGTYKYLSADTLRKRFQRADKSVVWENIQDFEGNVGYELQRVKDIKKPEVEYVKNSYKSIISTFVKLKRGDFCSHELTDILLEADRELKEKTGINIIDTARIKALDYMSHAKVFYESNGVIEDGFDKYQKDLINNIQQTYALIENEPSSILTFEQFQKRLIS